MSQSLESMSLTSMLPFNSDPLSIAKNNTTNKRHTSIQYEKKARQMMAMKQCFFFDKQKKRITLHGFFNKGLDVLMSMSKKDMFMKLKFMENEAV